MSQIESAAKCECPLADTDNCRGAFVMAAYERTANPVDNGSAIRVLKSTLDVIGCELEDPSIESKLAMTVSAMNSDSHAVL